MWLGGTRPLFSFWVDRGMLKQFFLRPYQSEFRRWVFQIHLWAGLVLGIHLAIVSVTGVLLLFKDEILAKAYPRLYSVEQVQSADTGDVIPVIDAIVESVKSNYPGYRIIRLDAPKAGRETFVVIAENADVHKSGGTYPRSRQ